MGKLELNWPVWIGVVARDLESQRRFYREVLGFRELEASEEWVEFDLGAGRKLEVLALDPEAPQYATPGYAVGFLVEDIRTAADELVARGVRRISEIEGGPDSGQYWCYFEDGEGNRFEIVQKTAQRTRPGIGWFRMIHSTATGGRHGHAILGAATWVARWRARSPRSATP